MEINIKNLLADSLFKLLKNNDINDISITKLCNNASISRTSFYNNFNNILDVINYKFDLIIDNLYKIYYLNNKRNKDIYNLCKEILKYIEKNKDLFLIIIKKFYFEFKNKLDNYFINKIDYKNYIITSGIIINIVLFYLNNKDIKELIKYLKK